MPTHRKQSNSKSRNKESAYSGHDASSRMDGKGNCLAEHTLELPKTTERLPSEILGSKQTEQSQENRRTEASLLKLQETLEQRVKERTSELALANKALRTEIAERRRIEELLILKDAGINAAISGICFATPDGLILYANEAFLQMWRFRSSGDVVGVHISGLYEDPDAFEREFSQLTKKGHYVGELDARRQDGTVFTVLISASLVQNDDQKILCIMGSFLDLTDRKHAAAELLRSKAMRAEAEKLAAAGRLAAKVAHEINNPLAGIKNAFHLFKEVIPKDCPERRFVDQTEKEIDRITRIVRQMYDLHRQNQERDTDMRIEEEIEEVIAMLESKCRKHGVRIETLPPLPKVLAHAPEGALRQILYSLLGNAIEASPREGVVGVGMAVRNEVLLISISDRGSGIPESLHNQIFEPFFSTKTGKGIEGGLGLGLQTARRLTEAMGGTLDFESEVDRGTVFRIHLPLGRIKGVLV